MTEKFLALQDNDKDQIKMLIKLDDHVSRIFFTRKVVVVEGDTEEVIIKEAIHRMPKAMRNKLLASTELVKARGKAAIIGLVKYLSALDVDFFVIHDRDGGTPGAESFNAPIAAAVGDASKVIMLEECIEDLLGYPAPSGEKPFKAYQEAQRWGDNWNDVPEPLRRILTRAFPHLSIWLNEQKGKTLISRELKMSAWRIVSAFLIEDLYFSESGAWFVLPKRIIKSAHHT